ncbi:MAG: ion channel [Sphingomicrobium sp.]
MALNIILFLVGLSLAGMVLKDVFDTVVVPGGSKTPLRVAHRLVVTLLPVWKQVRGRRRGLSTAFAPFVLVFSFIVWMMFLAIAFGLMAYAVRAYFQPHLTGFGEAVYLAGSSLVTVGLSQVNPAGLARWVILGAGFCGLAVMTMAVTYLLEVQSSVSRRDTGIIKLNTSAGEPPSALTLLERFAALRNEAALREVIGDARTWCATVRQSHASHPSLIYFQSVGTGSGWPAALGAALDLALIAEHLIDDDSLYGPAVLLREEGARMARELALMISVAPKQVHTDTAELDQLQHRVATSGYPLRANPNLEAMASQRAEHMSCVVALADHLGKPTAVLLRQS